MNSFRNRRAPQRFFMGIIAFVCATAGVTSAAPIVHPGDTLSVNVLNYAAVIDNSRGRLKALEPESLVVASDGSISMPVIGAVQVAGKSAREVAKIVEARLSDFMQDPAVTVRLVQQIQVIFLTGATVGTMPYLPGETLASGLGQLREQLKKSASQGMAPGDVYASDRPGSALDLRRIVIDQDGQLSQPIDGEQLLRTGLPGPALHPGDTLRFVYKPLRVDVRGEVANPGPIYLYPTDSLEQAVLTAGGPLSNASTADASLIRNGIETPLPLGGAALRQHPQDGDTIVIRAASHVTVIGQVPTPGELTLKNGSTLLSALYLAGGPTKSANVRDIQLVHNGARRSFNLSGLQHGDLSSNVPLSDGDVVYVPEGHRIDAGLFFQVLLGALGGIYYATHL